MTRKEVSRRDFLRAAGLGAAGIAAAACIPAPQSAAPEPTQQPESMEAAGPVSGGTLTIAPGALSFTNFTPWKVRGTSHYRVFSPVVQALVRGQEWGDGLTPQTKEFKITPELAEKVDVEEPDRVWVFHLRQNVKWHDGRPFTADDVMWSWFAATHRDVARQSGGLPQIKGAKNLGENGGTMEDLTGAQKIDEYTVRLELEATDFDFISSPNTRMDITPKHVFEDVPLDKVVDHEPFAGMPIGTGPFKCTQLVPDQFLAMERNDDYWGGKPLLDGIIFRFLDGNTAVAALEKGELDVGGTPDLPSFQHLKEMDHLVSATFPTPCYWAWYINVNRFPDTYHQLHQALLYGIDIDEYLAVTSGGLAVRDNYVYSHIGLGTLNQPPEGLTDYRFDPDKAQAILEEINWDFDRELEFSLEGEPTVGEETFQALAANMGLKLKFKVFHASAFVPEVFDNLDFDIYSNVQGCSTALGHFWRIVKCGGTPDVGGINWNNYCNPELDEVYAAAMQEKDLDKRVELLKQVALLVDQNLNGAPFFRGVGRLMYNARVQAIYPGTDYAKSVRVPHEKIWLKQT